jgi:hypothetical protein
MSGRPDVIVDVVFENGLLFLAVANIGDRPALEVRTTFNRKLVGLGGTKDVGALPLFRNISWFARRRATTVVARVAYRDPEKKEYKAAMTHDLEIYREIAYVRGD